MLLRATLALVLGTIVVTASLYSVRRDLLPFIMGRDDRVLIDEEGPPWNAIGQVNIGGYRIAWGCTGTLVAPDLVLTAAHCVMDPWKKAPHPVHRIHFLAGVQRAKYQAHSTAKCLRFLPTYKFIPWLPKRLRGKFKPMEERLLFWATDVVVIVLKEKLQIAPAPLAEGLVPRPGMRLVHASYGGDRRYSLYADLNCRLTWSHVDEPLWYQDCDTHFGGSGGPIFIEMDAHLKLAAILVGGRGSANVGLPISEWRSLVEHSSCPEKPVKQNVR